MSQTSHIHPSARVSSGNQHVDDAVGQKFVTLQQGTKYWYFHGFVSPFCALTVNGNCSVFFARRLPRRGPGCPTRRARSAQATSRLKAFSIPAPFPCTDMEHILLSWLTRHIIPLYLSRMRRSSPAFGDGSAKRSSVNLSDPLEGHDAVTAPITDSPQL